MATRTALRGAEAGVANADFKKVLESMQAFRNDEYFWWQVAAHWPEWVSVPPCQGLLGRVE